MLGWKSVQLLDTPYFISTFGEDEQGELYLADYATGKIYNIRYQEPVYDVSGNAGVSGATLSYMDGTPKTVPSGWSGTVTPFKSGYTFTPVNRSYNNVQSNQTAQNYTAQVCVGCADVNVTIGGAPQGSYVIPIGGRVTPIYQGINNGPVQVKSTNAVPIITSERAYRGVSNLTDFNEMMGFPANQLTTEYWFPLYDSTSFMQTYLTIGNAQ